MLGIKFNKKSKYIVACSFDAASMCLLDQVIKEGLCPVVAMIDYHLEKSTTNIASLHKYCESRNIPFELYDVIKDVDPSNEYKEGEDKRSWARDIRYSFFKRVYDKYDANGLFVAHNQDDLIEAYLLKDEFDKKHKSYKWNVVSEQYGMRVYRPLLKFSNEEILHYNEENHIPFATLTNEEVKVLVSPLKLTKIALMNPLERELILKEIDGKINDRAEFLDDLNRRIDKGGELDVREIIALNSNSFAETICNFISSVDETIKVTSDLLSSIRKMCLSENENESIQLSDSLFITKEYDILSIGGNIEKPLYSYTLPKPGKLKNEYFELDFSNGAADRGFRLSDYPLIIRPAVPQDLFNVHGFMTPVRKLYYDWRMPPKKKVIWPVIANKYGEIIYIPRYHRLNRTEHLSKFSINFSEDD